MRRTRNLALLLAAIAGGCGGEPLSTTDLAGMMSAPDLAFSPDLVTRVDQLRLVSADYTLAPGQELYLCKRVTMESDLLIHSITPVNGLATHHELLGIDLTGNSPDGTVDCNDKVEFDVLGWRMLFASGVNSPPLEMPEGVALVLHSGQQLVFQMHLLNASTKTVQSSASLDVTPLAPADFKDEAGMMLAGPLPNHNVTPDIPIGPGHVVNGTCTLGQAGRYFAVFPHMHRLGTHIAVSTTVGGQSATVYDADYRFDDQVFRSFPPLAMARGDSIGVSCTYDNETGAPVQFGQSSTQEMCFAISYLYPPPKSSLGPFCYQ